MPGACDHIEVTPGVCGGRPRIAGRRIRVQDIAAWHERLGYSPDEIVSRCDGLTLAQVYAALSYYHDHVEEIARAIREDSTEVDDLRSQTPSKLVQQLSPPDGDSDAVSP